MTSTEEPGKPLWTRLVLYFVLLSLVGSSVYAIIGYLNAPEAEVAVSDPGNVKSDYLLMLVQCILGIVVMILPGVIERRRCIEIPNSMYVFFLFFLYGAIFLGEVRSFYYRIPNWDLILHGFSGLLLGALSFSVVRLLNASDRIVLSLSPAFMAVFAFSFAMTVAALWEIYEFAVDGILGLNMQKFALRDGELLMGRAAVADTMEDLIVAAVGAAIMAVVGYVSIRERKGWLSGLVATRRGATPPDTD
ncbi:MAG TPA: hypothetical protein DEP45_03595 [Armatimonadetes bacterium]|nr:hypothetical protein [Armatimonadota bacterium]